MTDRFAIRQHSHVSQGFSLPDMANKESSSEKTRRVKWRTDNLVPAVRYFMKFDEPSRNFTEDQIIENKSKVDVTMNKPRRLKPLWYKNKEKGRYDSITIENVHWKPPRSKFFSSLIEPNRRLDTNLLEVAIPQRGFDNKDSQVSSLDREKYQKRIETKKPAIYGKDYQIPNNPRINYESPDNQASALAKTLELSFDLQISQDVIDMHKSSIKSLSELFELEKSKPKRPLKKGNIKGIMKKTWACDLYNKSLILGPNDIDIIKTLCITMGLSVANPATFVDSVNVYLSNMAGLDIYQLKANLINIRDLIDKYQRFKVQLNFGRPRCIMPIYCRNGDSQALQGPQHVKCEQSRLQAFPVPIEIPPKAVSTTKEVTAKPHPKWKTVPCVHFHSNYGCVRGDTCDFIHDKDYKGRQVPKVSNVRKQIDCKKQKNKREASNVTDPIQYMRSNEHIIPLIPYQPNVPFLGHNPIPYDPIMMRTQMFDSINLGKRKEGLNRRKVDRNKKFKLK